MPVRAPGAPTTDRVPVPMNTRTTARPLRLPEGVRLSLACISGPDSGRIFEIDKPRVVIGRANADIVVSDIQCSRQHAAIEIQDEHVFLVDLGSTNGTYVYDQRVGRTELENRAEFEIGTTTLMLIRSGGPHDSPSGT
jgi:pSer/pThr/pTyr-binding forkhead associated (FHA) protein